MAVFLSNGEASHLRTEGRRSGRSRADGHHHLQIASDPPVRSAVDALDCVSGESEKALKRNTRMNSETGNVEMMDANALVTGEARELRDEATLHEQRAQELEGIKRAQKSRHISNMKDIQASKAVRLQQQSSRHKSRDEVSALIQYPLLGFTLPSSINPIEYLARYSTTTAASPSAASKAGPVGALASGSDRGKAAGGNNRQLLRDRIEIFGDEAALEEVEKKKKKTKAAKKKHSKGSSHEQCKGECGVEEKLEDQKAEQQVEEEETSGPVKALHDVERAIASPFSGDDATAVFSDSSEDVDISGDNFEGIMEDPDEDGEASSNEAFSSTKAQNDDDEDGEEGSSGSAGFSSKNHAPAKAVKEKMGNSEEGEDEGGENQQEEEEAARKKAASHHKEKEAEQAKDLQQHQGMHQQQSFYHVKPLRGQTRTRLSDPYHSSDIHAAIETARLRFAAARKAAASTSSADEEDFEEEPGTSESTDEEEQQTSDLARSRNTRERRSRQEALATEELEAEEEILAAEKEAARTQASLEDEHKLLEAAEEVQQAQTGLKACAQGSFLSCRQAQRRRPQREPDGRGTSP
ncbi:uncharacterized protein EMH_0060770 [Eimeria mitis]|uniref:Uncharacterized protein n=1 Tax=Eimeria mitis TaxID=44415 RepID=U6KH17_9EIME|nr:uncharacterized protein EMH_0060770 [Eimeria mitis]CDJ36076.1 hypothetical protein, conserved [Eimeria mitis]